MGDSALPEISGKEGVPTSSIELLSSVMERPTNGVVGIADVLLAATDDLDLWWEDGQCRLRLGTNPVRQLKLHKSAFRAVLARLAAVGCERLAIPLVAESGQFELSTGVAGAHPGVRVSFVNTAAEQRLSLRASRQ